MTRDALAQVFAAVAARSSTWRAGQRRKIERRSRDFDADSAPNLQTPRAKKKKYCKSHVVRQEHFGRLATHSRKLLQRSLRVFHENAQVDVENRASLVQIRRQICNRRAQKEMQITRRASRKFCRTRSALSPTLKKYPMGYYTLYNILGYAGYFFLCFIMNSLYMGYFLHIPQKIRFIMEIK